jgi:hypothetical protein
VLGAVGVPSGCRRAEALGLHYEGRLRGLGPGTRRVSAGLKPSACITKAACAA